MTFFRHINPSALCFSLSAIALGHTLQISNGFYHPVSVNWLAASLVLALLGVLLHRMRAEVPVSGVTIMTIVLALGIAWQIQALLTASPGMYIRSEANRAVFTGLVAVQALAVVAGLTRIRALRRFWFPVVLVASLGLGVWMIKASPNPYIDVVAVHKEAIEAVLNGRDPYRISFPNVYTPELARVFYNPEALAGDRVLFSYPYPPASLLFVVPGHVLFGDYRYAELALLVFGAALIGWSRPGIVSKLAASLLLTTPRIWFVIEQGWTEPVGIFVLALTVFLLIRHSIPAGAAAGILVVTKQYLGFAGLAVIRLAFFRMRYWRWTTIAGLAAAAAITLPIALEHPNAFMRNVVWLQTLEPFRMDSLSFVSWAAREGMGQGSYLWAVGAAVAAAVLTTVVTRSSETGFAAAVSLTTFAMFAFGSKAFCNYYFFVVGALCCTIGAYPVSDSGPATASAGARTADPATQ